MASNSGKSDHHMTRRMTRFFVTVPCDEILCTLQAVLEKEGYRVKRNDGMLTITTIDKRKNPLVIKAISVKMDGKVMLDFRLARGCGLEFKRKFLGIRTALGKHVLPDLEAFPDTRTEIKLPDCL